MRSGFRQDIITPWLCIKLAGGHRSASPDSAAPWMSIRLKMGTGGRSLESQRPLALRASSPDNSRNWHGVFGQRGRMAFSMRLLKKCADVRSLAVAAPYLAANAEL